MEEIEYSIQFHVILFVFVHLKSKSSFALFHIALCPCGSIHKLLFELITDSTVIVGQHISLICVCMYFTSLQFTMSYSGACSQQVWIGSQGLQRRTTTASGIQSSENSPGRYSMAASARGVGSYPSHRPGVTHMETPSTVSAFCYGSGARTIRNCERSDSRGRERRRSRDFRSGSRSVSVSGVTKVPQMLEPQTLLSG